MFTSSPLTAMLHLVSQATNQGNNQRRRTDGQEQRQGSLLLSQIVSSLRDRDPQDTDEEENIF